jgi:WD40 repeat protein
MIRLLLVLIITLLTVPLIAQDDTATPISLDNADALPLAWTITAHDLPINDLDFSDDGTMLVSASDDLSTASWDVETGEEQVRFEGQLHQVRSVDVAPDGRTVLTTGFNGIAFLWDVRSVTRASSVNADGFPSISDGEFAPDGESYALAMGDGVVRVYDLETEAVLQTLPASALLVERIAYHPDATHIVAGIGFPSDHALVWDLDSGEVVATLSGHNGTVYGVDYAPDGAAIVTGGGDGSLIVWDNEGYEPLWTVEMAHDGSIYDVVFSPSGDLLATVGFDGVLRLWDAATGDPLADYTPLDPARSLLAVAFTAQGDAIAVAGESGEIWLWRVE